MFGRAPRAIGGMAAVGLFALIAGCGGSTPNEPRAPNPIATTVRITDDAVVVSPNRFGFGEQNVATQPRSAAEVQAEAEGKTVTTPEQTPPETDADQPLELTIANLSGQNAILEIKGPTEATTAEIAAGSTGNIKVALRTGTYVVSARGDFSPKPGKILIGPERRSAQNDLLLP